MACRENIALDLSDAGGGSGGSGGGKDGGMGTGGACEQLPAALRLPELIIALDHSNAMSPPFSNLPSRLAATQQEIQKIVQSYQSLIWFGYEEFPATDASTCANGSGCCAGTVTPPSLGVVGISHALFACTSGPSGCISSSSQRPIADALAQIGKALSPTTPNGHHRYVLLITAGDGNCGDGSGCFDAMMQASNLQINSSVRTFVLGIGNDVASSNCLDNIAQSGGEPLGANPPFFYFARTQTDLDQAMGNIVGQQVAEDACQIDLAVPASDPSRVQVQITNNQGDWTTVPPDRFNGWDFHGNTNSQISLNGDACSTLIDTQNAQVQVLSGSGCKTH